MTKQEAMSSFHAKLSAKLIGFDPTIIIAIITAILKMLELCKPKAETIIADAKNGGTVFGKVLLRRELAREGVPFKDRPKVIEAVYGIAAEELPESIAAFQTCNDPEE